MISNVGPGLAATHAPPAFLLDSDRMKAPAPDPGRFDNRWLVFPQDFPSAAFLRSRVHLGVANDRPCPRWSTTGGARPGPTRGPG